LKRSTNKASGAEKFYTRGSHGKWYWPWAMPTAWPPLGERIATVVSAEFTAYERGRGRLRTLSDSSDGSSIEGAPVGSSLAQKESAGSLIHAERGGDVLQWLKSLSGAGDP